MVYGTLRLRGRLDFHLGELVRGDLEVLQPDVLDVLRLGTYQLLEMGSVPAYAAISQSVELARAAGAWRAAGLVNGVLQALRRKGEALALPSRAENPLRHLAVKHSHPEWLVERWISAWGEAETEMLLEANNLRPELFLRPLGMSAESARERLRETGIDAESVPFAADSLRILPPATPLEALGRIPAVVQDPAAALVVRYAAVPSGGTILDLCSAPGGKSLGMVEAAGLVVAADLSVRRLGRVRENAERVGEEERLAILGADARHPPFRDGAADLVLIDAPCTGTGTLRRHPDGRWRTNAGDLAALVSLQREILEAAAVLVAPGGWLVYATCSLEPEENGEQVRAFLAAHPEFAPDPPTGWQWPELLDTEGWLSVLPQRMGFDGSFAARMRKRM